MSIRFVDINGIVEEVFRRCEVFADIPGLGSIFSGQSKMDNPEKLAT
jgi:hypothetical protein